MFASIFQVLIIKPIINLLIAIYVLLPGHNFGMAIIIFTILIRLLMLPLVRKQLRHAKAMREMAPELKKIKAATKGDRQKTSQLTMELYKERQINPLGPIGVMVIQLIVVIGLYQGLRKIVADPNALITESYGFLRDTSWMKNLASNISHFDSTLLGFIDLKRAAIPKGVNYFTAIFTNGIIYWPAMALVFGSALAQFFQSRQLMPKSDDSRKLRQILKDASNGKNSDNSEVNASIMKTTQYFIPFMIFFFTVRLPSALSLYWLVSGVTAYIQQAKILKQDENDMQAIANKSGSKVVIEGEVVPKKAKPKTKTKPAKKRRKK